MPNAATASAEPSAADLAASVLAASEAANDGTPAAQEGGDAAPAAKVEPKPDDKAAKPEAEDKKPNWGGVLKAERKARESVAAAQAERDAARAEAKKASDAAAARVAEVEARAKELQPLTEAVAKKDTKAILALLGLSMVDVAHAVAEDGKAPTVEEMKAQIIAEAKAALEAENAKRDAAAKAQAEADRKKSDETFAAAVTSQLTGIAAALGAADNAEKFAVALKVDKLMPALGLDRGRDVIEYDKGTDGKPFTVEIEGGTVVSRAALGLMLKIMSSTRERITPAEAIERVQKSLAPVLQELREEAAATAKTTAKKPEQTKSGGAAQPTLSQRSTTGSVTEPDEADDDDRVDEASVLKAARAALPHLRPHLRD